MVYTFYPREINGVEAKMIFNVVDGTYIMGVAGTHMVCHTATQLLTTKTELTAALYCEMPYVGS